MVGNKTVADVLTGSRFLLGLVLGWLGWQYGPEALASAALILLAAWTTDLLDGPLARRDPRGIQTWIGRHDLAADVMVCLGVWLYLTLAGFVPLWLALAYLLLAAAAVWYTGSAHVTWAVQALPYGAMVWTAWRLAPPFGWLLAAWVGLVVAATWPRVWRQTLPDFFAAMRNLWRRA